MESFDRRISSSQPFFLWPKTGLKGSIKRSSTDSYQSSVSKIPGYFQAQEDNAETPSTLELLNRRFRILYRSKKGLAPEESSSKCPICSPMLQESLQWPTCRFLHYHLNQSSISCQTCKTIALALNMFTSPEEQRFRRVLSNLDSSVEVRGQPGRILFLFGDKAEKEALSVLFRKPTTLNTLTNNVLGPFSSRSEPVRTSSDIATRSDSEDAFKTVKAWIKICNRDHPLCHQSKHVKLPSRVLDVGHGKGSPVKLILPKGKEGTQYIALSHCWGSKHTFMTKSTNLEKRLQGIEWSKLPKTFQDAVTITRKLNIRYLWIDSLCILQDSESDWHFESAKMGEIYTNSYLTIAAALAPNDRAGIFHSRSEETHEIPNGVTVKLSLTVNHLDPQTVDPLLTRSWAFQERILPARVLSYGSEELKWHCKTSEHCECGFEWPEPPRDAPNEMLQAHRERRYHELIAKATALAIEKEAAEVRERHMLDETGAFLAQRTKIHDPDWDIDDEERLNLYDYWRDFVVPAYTRLGLTMESDRLPALSAIASGIEKAVPDTYLAGLWRKDVRHGLAWSASPDASVPSAYRGPSWSWVSIEGPITYWPLLREKSPTTENRWASYRDTRCLRPTKPSLRVLKANCVPVSSNNTGAVKAGLLKLRGDTYTAELKPVTRFSSGACRWDVNAHVQVSHPRDGRYVDCEVWHGTLILDPGRVPPLPSNPADPERSLHFITLLYLGEEYTTDEAAKPREWQHDLPKGQQHPTPKAFLVLRNAKNERRQFERIGLFRGASMPAGIFGTRKELTIV